ncbi:hypothetical protein NDU88_003171 [Pleurodeles waltl]|uniref:Uncharacterized protein n=1 Tax=Pleurodeles waltl TaxID=8319 RepID=A0AAV7KUT5_PLEWA|nr:hypothetical protein NDU88_003171 [Pleurodeles waltl]
MCPPPRGCGGAAAPLKLLMRAFLPASARRLLPGVPPRVRARSPRVRNKLCPRGPAPLKRRAAPKMPKGVASPVSARGRYKSARGAAPPSHLPDALLPFSVLVPGAC